MSFWEVVWLGIGVALTAHLIVVLALITDLFHDPHVSGTVKTVWTLYLVLLPVLAAIVYLVAKGRDVRQGPLRTQDQVALATSSLDRQPAVPVVHQQLQDGALP